MRYVIILNNKKGLNRIKTELRKMRVPVHGQMHIIPIIFATLNQEQLKHVKSCQEVKNVEISTNQYI